MENQTHSGDGLSSHALFEDLVRLHGEENGGLEDFYMLDEMTIGCRYGDCCIRLKEDGWHYSGNIPAHPTPTLAFENRAGDYHSTNVEVSDRPVRLSWIPCNMVIKRSGVRICNNRDCMTPATVAFEDTDAVWLSCDSCTPKHAKNLTKLRLQNA